MLNFKCQSKGYEDLCNVIFSVFSLQYICKFMINSFLLCHCVEWGVDLCGKKSYLKQFNIRTQHKKVKKLRCMKTFYRHCTSLHYFQYTFFFCENLPELC